MNIININKKAALEELLDQILNKSIHPQDNYEIAALLESFGWNDVRAANAFGVSDVFELSMILWDMIRENVSFQGFVEEKKESFYTKTKEVISSFLRGMIFALPMAISVLSMLSLRFSLWSYKYLSTDKATSIAFGTILSFMSVGGFTQAIARRGFFYIGQGYYNMAKRVTYALVRFGYGFCIFIALAYMVINWIFPIFTFDMIFLTIAFYLFLSSNWLAVTVMYILRREFTFTALITAGIGIVYVLFRIFKLDIIVSQLIALVFISLLGIILVVYFFNQAEKKMEKGIAVAMPKASIVLYSLGPYFKYGLLYFTFLFIDRIISWSTDGATMPYFIWFRGDYELGLDFALLMLIIPMGFSEVAVTRLMEKLEIIQKNSLSHETEDIKSQNFKTYVRSIIMVGIVSLISAVVIYLGVVYLNSHQFLGYDDLVLSNITIFVFIVALVAYLILCIALTNAVILFALSQPDLVTKVMLLSTIINFISGFLLSRWFGYEFAVFGLLFGSIIFAVLTTKNVIKVMLNLDYYLYYAS